uniref:Apple domain-containing protein n=1 Tax=Globisporangium ultimum (strain ATCC 200006 / CBS 805.95 / DAOM BR144) TaxID=431595 RepID=K3WZD7_GLOUD
MKTPTALFPVSLCVIAACLPSPTSAWELGSNERVKWSTQCGFADASTDRGVPGAASDCGNLCADDPNCTHWTWKGKGENTSVDMCFLKGDTADEATHRGDAHCGYVIERFDGAIDPNEIKPAVSTTQGGPQTISNPNDKPNDSRPNPDVHPVEPSPNGKVSDWAPGSNGRVNWSFNCEIAGEDIQLVTGEASVCGDVCADNASCTHWTWKQDGQSVGTCFLKSGALGNATPLTGAGCGYVLGRSVTPSSPPSGGDKPVSSNCDYYGNDIEDKHTPQSTDCAAACEQNPACTHWTWTSQDENCFLKKADKPYTTILSDAHCGYIANRVSGTPNTPTELSPSQKEVPTNANANSSQDNSANSTANPNASGSQGNTVSTDDGTDDGNISINDQLDTTDATGSRTQAMQDDQNDTGLTTSEIEAMLDQINQLRKASDLAPVAFNEFLAVAAREQSLYQASRCTLTDSDGGEATLSQRVTGAGYSNDVVYSVIADGQQDVMQVIGAWFGPRDQSSSIVHPDATEVGFAKAENLECPQAKSYLVQIFSSPKTD